MSWHAIEAIDEAIDDARVLLLPFDRGTWARLAIIVIFTGGAGFNPIGSIPTDFGDQDFSGDTSTYQDPATGIDNLESTGAEITGMAASSTSLNTLAFGVLAIIILALVPFLLFVSSVFEFIYYQSLLDENVSIRENFRKHWRKGLSYTVFRFAYFALLMTVVIGVILGFAANISVGALILLGAVPVFILMAVLSGLVKDFVLPSMIEEKEGIIASAKRLWPQAKAEWREVTVYVLVKFGLGVAIGIAITLLSLILVVPFLLVFGILGAVSYMLWAPLAAVPALVGIVLFVGAVLGVTVAFRTFLYYYVLEVFHRIFS